MTSFERRVIGMIPADHGGIAVLIEAYLDESGTNEGDLAHVVAGYLIKPGQAECMASEWQGILDKYGLPFFHMTDCAHYEVCEPYRSLGREKCIALATELIELIHNHCLNGFAVCFPPRFYRPIPDKDIYGENFYDFSVGFAHLHIQRVLTEYGFTGRAAYFLEAGHRHQRQARAILDRLQEDEKWKKFNYAFFDKESATLLQAADILAWHCATHVRRKVQGLPIRKDLRALMEKVGHYILKKAE